MSTAAYRYHHHQLSNERMDTRIEIMMTNIRELYSNFVVKLQEGACTIGSKKRIEIMSEYVDIRPGDILLDVSGNTGRGKRLQICEDILHTGAKLYEPTQLREKVEDHGLEVLYIKPTTLAYFLIAVKKVFKNK